MNITVNGRRYPTKRHTRTFRSEIEARGLALSLTKLATVFPHTVHYHRSDVDRFTVVWNTKEKRGDRAMKKTLLLFALTFFLIGDLHAAPIAAHQQGRDQIRLITSTMPETPLGAGWIQIYCIDGYKYLVILAGGKPAVTQMMERINGATGKIIVPTRCETSLPD